MTDNEKTVTVEHVVGIPVRNHRIVAFDRHYSTSMQTCLPADPFWKGGVENAVRIAKADLVPKDTYLLPGFPSPSRKRACEVFMLTRPGTPAIIDAHFPPAPAGALERVICPTNKAEEEFLALGAGAALWLKEAAAGTEKIRHKMERAVTLAKVLTDTAVENVIALMRTTRMPHARAVVADVLATAKAQRWDPAEVIRVLLEAEATGRNRSMLATRRKRAGFPTGKTFDVWDKALSTLPAATTSFLWTLEWVRRRDNLIVYRPSGTGKTLLLEALGQQAIDQGMSVSWLSLEDLGALVRRQRIDDSVNKAITRATGVDLICIDDIGLLPVSAGAAGGFYRVVEASYEKRSLANSSNIHPSGLMSSCPKPLPPPKWTGSSAAPTCAGPAASSSGSWMPKMGKERAP